MRILKLLFILFFGFYQEVIVSQEKLNSNQAFEQYQNISQLMNTSFPEDEIRTFQRMSFSQSELEIYLSQHFQRMDLLNRIEGRHILKLEAYIHSGNWFNLVDFPKESIKSFQNFFKYYKEHESDLSSEDRKSYNVMRFLAHGIIAENYARLGQLENAKKEHHINIAFTKTHNDIYYNSAINNFGLFYYWHKKDLDSALIYFKEAYDLTRIKYSKHFLLGSIQDNIADIYYDQKNYVKAQALYASNFKFYQEVKDESTMAIDIPRLISAGAQLVSTSLYLNQIEKAANTFEDLEDIVMRQDQAKLLSAESRLNYLKSKEQLLYSQNKSDQAYTILKYITKFSDSLQKVSSIANAKWQNEFNTITVDRVALNFKLEQLKKETKIKSQRAQLWIVGTTSIAFIILLILLYFNRKQRHINSKNKQLIAEQNLENSLLKVNKLDQEIKSKQRDLSDFAINLIENQKWALTLATKLEAYRQANDSDKPEQLRNLELVVKNKITFDEDTTLFFERLDKLSDAFYSELMTNYPNLSKNEIRLCSLIRLKIDSRSIATLQNITTASLNTSRYRLRKKLDLADDVNLDDFILSL